MHERVDDGDEGDPLWYIVDGGDPEDAFLLCYECADGHEVKDAYQPLPNLPEAVLESGYGRACFACDATSHTVSHE